MRSGVDAFQLLSRHNFACIISFLLLLACFFSHDFLSPSVQVRGTVKVNENAARLGSASSPPVHGPLRRMTPRQKLAALATLGHLCPTEMQGGTPLCIPYDN